MLKIEVEGNRKKVYRSPEDKPEAIIERRGDGSFRWTNCRGIDGLGNEKINPPEGSTGISKTEKDAFLKVGYKFIATTKKKR